MGKITNIQDKYNKIENDRKKEEIKKKIKGFKKNISILIGHSSNLTKAERKFQIVGRTTIAAIATAFAITGGATTIAHNLSYNNTSAKETEKSTEYLDSKLIIEEAHSKIKQYVYGEDKEKIENSFISYEYDPHDNNTSFMVGQGDIDSNNKKVDFSYHSAFSIDNLKNAPDINKLVKKLIEIYKFESDSKEPSQDDLRDIQNILDELDTKNLKLKNKHIVEEREKDLGEER